MKNSARHRRPQPIRDIVEACVLMFLLWFSKRWPSRPGSAEVRAAGTRMARLPWTAERIPLQVSPAEHWAGVRQIEDWLSGADAPLA